MTMGPHGLIQAEQRDLIIDEVKPDGGAEDEDGTEQEQRGGVALEVLVSKLRE